MAITILLHHDQHYDLLRPEDAKGLESTGQFEVETREGTELRERVQIAAPDGHTVLELPDDYDASPQALLHLVQMLTDRHATEVDIVAVSGDSPIVARLAALLDAEARPATTSATTSTGG